MLFLGFGTGLGSALIAENVIVPLELGQLPYRKGLCLGDLLGRRGLPRAPGSPRLGAGRPARHPAADGGLRRGLHRRRGRERQAAGSAAARCPVRSQPDGVPGRVPALGHGGRAGAFPRRGPQAARTADLTAMAADLTVPPSRRRVQIRCAARFPIRSDRITRVEVAAGDRTGGSNKDTARFRRPARSCRAAGRLDSPRARMGPRARIGFRSIFFTAGGGRPDLGRSSRSATASGPSGFGVSKPNSITAGRSPPRSADGGVPPGRGGSCPGRRASSSRSRSWRPPADRPRRNACSIAGGGG